MFTDNFSPETHRKMFLRHFSYSVVTLAQYGMPSDRHHQDVPHTAVTLAQHGLLSDSHDLDVPHTVVSAEIIQLYVSEETKIQALLNTENITGSCYRSLLVREHWLFEREFNWLCTPALSVLSSPYVKARYEDKARYEGKYSQATFEYQILPGVTTQVQSWEKPQAPRACLRTTQSFPRNTQGSKQRVIVYIFLNSIFRNIAYIIAGTFLSIVSGTSL